MQKLQSRLLTTEATDVDAFMEEKWQGDAAKTVKDALVEQVAVIGENLKIRQI